MTEPRSYLDVLPEVTRRILAASKPEKIVLFGSYARGDLPPKHDRPDLPLGLGGRRDSK
jgi:predicted nucleotidyltransferase